MASEEELRPDILSLDVSGIVPLGQRDLFGFPSESQRNQRQPGQVQDVVAPVHDEEVDPRADMYRSGVSDLVVPATRTSGLGILARATQAIAASQGVAIETSGDIRRLPLADAELPEVDAPAVTELNVVYTPRTREERHRTPVDAFLTTFREEHAPPTTAWGALGELGIAASLAPVTLAIGGALRVARHFDNKYVAEEPIGRHELKDRVTAVTEAGVRDRIGPLLAEHTELAQTLVEAGIASAGAAYAEKGQREMLVPDSTFRRVLEDLMPNATVVAYNETEISIASTSAAVGADAAVAPLHPITATRLFAERLGLPNPAVRIEGDTYDLEVPLDAADTVLGNLMGYTEPGSKNDLENIGLVTHHHDPDTRAILGVVEIEGGSALFGMEPGVRVTQGRTPKPFVRLSAVALGHAGREAVLHHFEEALLDTCGDNCHGGEVLAQHAAELGEVTGRAISGQVVEVEPETVTDTTTGLGWADGPQRY